MSLKDAIRIADAERKQPESNKAVNIASNNTIQIADEITPPESEIVGLTIRVPKDHRIHWLIGAKKEGTSLTAAITEAMNARFGEPEED